MFNTSCNVRTYLFGICFGFVTSTSMAGHATNPGNPIPVGFTGFITYTMDGEFDVATPNPEVPDCFFLWCDGQYYWDEVVGASAEEVEAARNAAKAFFQQRFGLDVDALVASNDIVFRNIYIDPRANYRARTVSGERVHKLGWEVHDQAFIVLTQNNVLLGGEFENEVAPIGTLFAFGQYSIEKSKLIGSRRATRIMPTGELLTIHYQSGAPVTPPGLNRVSAFSCEVTDSPWGAGLAQGVGATRVLGDGVLPGSLQKQNTRNVLSFDGDDGLGNFVGVHN